MATAGTKTPVDGLLILGLASISFACLLWLNFTIVAITGVGFTLYPASEHALLFLWGIALSSQSELARAEGRPRLAGPAVLPLAITISALIFASIVSSSAIITAITWQAIAIALLMALYAEGGRRQPLLTAGLLCGWLGAMLMALTYSLPLLVPEGAAAAIAPIAKLLVFDAMPQLILLGLITASIPGRSTGPAAALFLASVIADGASQPAMAFSLRAAAIAIAVVPRLRTSSPLSFWHRLVAAFWVGGTLGIAFWPIYTIHLKHFIYFGVYLTLAAVVIAAPLRLRHHTMTRKRYNWVAGLVALGAVTRATAFVSAASYTRHLGYAALIVLVAIGLAVPAYLSWRRREP